MSLLLSFTPHILRFKFEAGTSRGVLTEKTTYILTVRDEEYPTVYGVGEAGPLKGLSIDDVPDFEDVLTRITAAFNDLRLGISGWEISKILERLVPDRYPSIRFGLEAALLDFGNGGRRIYFENGFSAGDCPIAINGLIWMGDERFMADQIETKLAAGYRTIKMKVGAIDFDRECRLLAAIRKRFSADEVTLRVDANGAFAPDEALHKLGKLHRYELHSIEQPIRQGQHEAMAALVRESPVAIALDEELIGVQGREEKKRLLEEIRPPFLIFKPSLLGGFSASKEWISLAGELGIAWWITSALESNIGLNAIAQFTASFDNPLPQGLGTGQLYHNNFESSLYIEKGTLRHRRPGGTLPQHTGTGTTAS
ncbi:o-succinylbenzoate synthase [Ravibacter arvi]|uniref:O-succinylbenzoate synthase n=1 Tax=Ravibacter arvi TaxID=2051041 RepID=A0ABP8LTA9_9BACT